MVSVEKLGPPQKLDVLASVFLVGFAERHGAGILSVAEVLAKAGGAPPPGGAAQGTSFRFPKARGRRGPSLLDLTGRLTSRDVRLCP